MKLVVLESPNKVKKVAHYLGSGYDVVATAGHFRDLPRDDLGVDLSSFDPNYVVDPNKQDLLARIKSKAKSADEVLLATDADREGEAISWHLAQELRLKRPMRLKYTEITEKALKDAVARLTPLDQHLVDAQQARRVLDRLVGYQVSPLLSRRFGKGNSAGRVQSATLHLVVLRELERERFKSEPYWTLAALYTNGLRARYASVGEDGKLADTRLKTEAEANAIAERARAAPHVVKSVETKPAESRPSPPFTTSTLQQAASRKLHFTPDHTMDLAQKLFEAGVITYHRTDSVALSDDAIEMARTFIAKDFPEALPAAPVRYKMKADAQGAHEAIRPTSLDPGASSALSGDELRLYDLVRQRFLACQCKPAVLSRTTITIEAADTTWRAMGSVVIFESFRRYLTDPVDPGEKADSDEDGELPKVAPGDALTLDKLEVEAKKTTPPGRYTQASLIAAMEKSGIGRPSTYAPTVKLLFDRTYIAEEKKQLYPTHAGRRIDAALGQTFPEILETETTAELEKKLDDIADGSRPWKDEIREWYGPFSRRLAAAEPILDAEAAKYPELRELAQAGPKPTGKACPRCGAELHLRQRNKGKGEFLSCSAYPKCEYAADASAKPFDKPCPKCGGPMDELSGKYGAYAKCSKADCGATVDLAPVTEEACPVCSAPMKDKGDFFSCSKYPECKGTYDKKALAKAKKNNTRCPDCGAYMLERKGAKGPFLGCSAYPKCKRIDQLPVKRK